MPSYPPPPPLTSVDNTSDSEKAANVNIPSPEDESVGPTPVVGNDVVAATDESIKPDDAEKPADDGQPDSEDSIIVTKNLGTDPVALDTSGDDAGPVVDLADSPTDPVSGPAIDIAIGDTVNEITPADQGSSGDEGQLVADDQEVLVDDTKLPTDDEKPSMKDRELAADDQKPVDNESLVEANSQPDVIQTKPTQLIVINIDDANFGRDKMVATSIPDKVPGTNDSGSKVRSGIT